MNAAAVATKTLFDSRTLNSLPLGHVRSNDAFIVTSTHEALVHLVMLAEQLPGVRALGIELLGLLALAIRAPLRSSSAFILARSHEKGRGLVHLRVHPAARVVIRRGLDPLSVVGRPVVGGVLV